MAASVESQHPAKRPTQLPPPPSKRICTSPRTTSTPVGRPTRTLQSILFLPEDAVYGLPKQLLREYFLTLQSYAQNPYPISPSLPSPTLPLTHLPSTSPFLRLPLEIRTQIYAHLLPPPSNTPLKGPHPRQLQTHIHLTQPIAPALLILNHQIRSEALPVLYGGASQVVYVKIDYNLWVHKTRRSDLILSSALTSSIKNLHLSIHLGSEKRSLSLSSSSRGTAKHEKSSSVTGTGTGTCERVEAAARITEVKKGIKKVGKWLSGADIQSLRISWQEPPQTYSWEQKRDVLDGMRVLRAVKVDAGEINWGLNWNKGRRYRFEIEYLRELERGRQVVGVVES